MQADLLTCMLFIHHAFCEQYSFCRTSAQLVLLALQNECIFCGHECGDELRLAQPGGL